MKRFYKFTALMIAMFLVASLFAGCGNNGVAGTGGQKVDVEEIANELSAKYDELIKPDEANTPEEFSAAFSAYVDLLEEVAENCEEYPESKSLIGVATKITLDLDDWSGKITTISEQITDNAEKISFLEKCLANMDTIDAASETVRAGLENLAGQ